MEQVSKSNIHKRNGIPHKAPNKSARNSNCNNEIFDIYDELDELTNDEVEVQIVIDQLKVRYYSISDEQERVKLKKIIDGMVIGLNELKKENKIAPYKVKPENDIALLELNSTALKTNYFRTKRLKRIMKQFISPEHAWISDDAVLMLSAELEQISIEKTQRALEICNEEGRRRLSKRDIEKAL